MSDNQKTPRKTARVNSERFNTELEAVWYAANYYNKVSYQHLGEYIGVVFRENYGQRKYGITVRGDGDFFQSKVSIGDVPHGTEPIAVWHTHVPSCAAKDPIAQVLLYLFTTGDADWDQFSGADRTLADKATKAARKLFTTAFPSIWLLRLSSGDTVPERAMPSKAGKSSLRITCIQDHQLEDVLQSRTLRLNRKLRSTKRQ
jgi:hypothetical protein